MRTRQSVLERIGGAVVLLLLLVSAAFADEVRLKNGDRISGKVVSLDRGILTFDTGHGAVALPWADVTGVVIVEPVILAVTGQPAVTAAVAMAPDGRVTIGAATVVALADLVSIHR